MARHILKRRRTSRKKKNKTSQSDVQSVDQSVTQCFDNKFVFVFEWLFLSFLGQSEGERGGK